MSDGVVLVVDDEPANLYATSRTLERAGFEVLSCSSGAEALELASGCDVVLLDVNLGGLSGVEVMRRLKASEETELLPVVLVSAVYVDDESHTHGLEEGADGYLTRPIDGSVLVATVRAFARARRAERVMRERLASEMEAQRRLTETLGAISDGFLALDAEWSITYVNPRAEALLRRSADGLVGSRLWDAFPELVGTEYDLCLRDAAASGRAREFESRSAFGLYLAVRVYPVPGGLVVYFADMSVHRTAQREAATANAHVAELRELTVALAHATDMRAVCRVAATRAAAALGGPTAVVAWPYGGRPAEILATAPGGTGVGELLSPDAQPFILPLVTAQGAESALVIAADGDGANASFLDAFARQAAQALERARLYEQLRTRARAAEALRNIEEAVVLVDADRCVVFVNPAAEILFATTAGEVEGRPAAQVLSGWPQIEQQTMAAGASERAVVTSVNMQKLTLAIVRTDFSGGTVYALRDVTEERGTAQLRDEMLATVSHELRTPLAAVYGAARTLEAGRFDDATRAMLVETIARGCERLRDRIEQIHLAAVVEEQSLLFPGAEAELGSIVRDVAAEFERVLPPQFEVRVRVPPEPVEVPRDPDRIRRVLVSLLENAVAYSPDGGPIEIHVTQSDEGPCIEVADRGIGVPPAAADRIFDKFYRLDAAMGRGTGGIGLSLFVSRELVMLMGGRIWARPRPGGGTVVAFTLPQAAVATAASSLQGVAR